MYARAAIIGRVTRERNERQSRIIIQPPPPKPAANLFQDIPMSKQCFIPCERGPWSILVLAFVLLSMGGAMCNFAFHAEMYSTTEKHENNETTVIKNMTLHKGLKSLTYIGPTFMGIGAFLIIVCCVLLFDIREKRLRETVKQRTEQQQDLSREYTNKAILAKRANAANGISYLASVAEVMTTGDSDSQITTPTSNDVQRGTNSNCYRPLQSESSTESLNVRIPHDLESAIEQINNISTISQPATPKLILESRTNSVSDEYSADKWLPLIRLSALYDDRGPIIEYRQDKVNSGYQHSDYELKTQENGINSHQHTSDNTNGDIQNHSQDYNNDINSNTHYPSANKPKENEKETFL